MRRTPLWLIRKIFSRKKLQEERQRLKRQDFEGKPPLPRKPYTCPYLHAFYNLARFAGPTGFQTFQDIVSSVDVIRFSKESEIRAIVNRELVIPSKRQYRATQRLLNEVLQILSKLKF